MALVGFSVTWNTLTRTIARINSPHAPKDRKRSDATRFGHLFHFVSPEMRDELTGLLNNRVLNAFRHTDICVLSLTAFLVAENRFQHIQERSSAR
jgi:hypothetical protein